MLASRSGIIDLVYAWSCIYLLQNTSQIFIRLHQTFQQLFTGHNLLFLIWLCSSASTWSDKEMHVPKSLIMRSNLLPSSSHQPEPRTHFTRQQPLPNTKPTKGHSCNSLHSKPLSINLWHSSESNPCTCTWCNYFCRTHYSPGCWCSHWTWTWTWCSSNCHRCGSGCSGQVW